MNSMPPQTAAPAAEPSGQSARGRVADYDRLVDDLAYTYEGIFSRDSIAQAVADARQALEPTATIPDFLPILVSRRARGAAHHVRSAGSKPTDKINPKPVQVLAERGITLTEAYPKPLTNDVVRAADVIVTMGCGEPVRSITA
jgi:arsenate reductase (thioredoxin)